MFHRSMKLTRCAKGATLSTLSAGSPFGEASLLRGEKRNASIRAISYCDVYRLTKHNFDGLLVKYPEFGARVREIMAQRQQDCR